MEASSEPSAVVVALEEARRRLRGEPTEPARDAKGRRLREVDDWFAEEEQLAEAVPEPVAPVPRRLNVNTAGFEDLRAVGLSVTQAKRLLAHREGLGGFRSLDELESISGFPRDLLAELRRRATL
jgi:DNA uptake protein ComE-like DNA-binding protein